MLSIIIPTYNRDYCLAKTLPYLLEQCWPLEIIVVDDGGTDNTESLIEQFARNNPKIIWKYLRTKKNCGATEARRQGLSCAQFDYIAFCDDDDFLMPSYLSKCLERVRKTNGIVSGRHFYRQVGEPNDQALLRFGQGLQSLPPIDPWTLMINKDAIQKEIVSVPFTHGLIVTSKQIAEKYLTPHQINKGNGFREETIFQIKAFADGVKVEVLPDAFAIGLNRQEVLRGGQRVGRLARFYWTVRYNAAFLQEFWEVVKPSVARQYSWHVAQLFFIGYQIYLFFVRPFVVLFRKALFWSNK